MNDKKPSWITIGILALSFLFLYGPLLLVIIYSFNDSRLVTVWSHFSTRWYGELFQDKQLLQAAWVSLRIAFLTATTSVILGTLASWLLYKSKHFRGKTFLASLTAAPLVMPEIMVGLSLLLLFVMLESLIGWPAGRGTLTIWIAHTTFSTAYVTILIASRLRSFDPTLEEAALDLGAKPAQVFLKVTLPLLAPSLLAGWLLAFILSIDDLIIASFVAGPSATTLPMVIYSSIRLGMTPKIQALASLLMVLVIGLSLMWGWWYYRAEKAQSRSE